MNQENIYIKGDKLVVEIPLLQEDFDAVNQSVGYIANIIGVISGDDQGFCQLSSRTYAGKDPDICDFIVKTNFSREEFIALCKELAVDFYEYPLCQYCRKPIFGAYTFGKKGDKCFDCEDKK